MFHGRLDDERFGVVGHSFGGMTSIGAAAGWAGAPPDPRVDAVAPISAVIDGDLQSDERTSPYAGFSPDQLGAVSVPVMLLGGTADVNVPVANNALAFDWLGASPKVYRADILGANHTHFSNVCAIGDLLIDNGIPPQMWDAIGAADLVEPYAATCGPDAFPIEEATRLQNVFVVAFFRRHLLGETDYDHYLSPEYAETEAAIAYWEREL
jgi:predicted dienelactone hydrolase